MDIKANDVFKIANCLETALLTEVYTYIIANLNWSVHSMLLFIDQYTHVNLVVKYSGSTLVHNQRLCDHSANLSS
jgi:hypothetical protein